jgi:hypothetical protein
MVLSPSTRRMGTFGTYGRRNGELRRCRKQSARHLLHSVYLSSGGVKEQFHVHFTCSINGFWESTIDYVVVP